MSLAARVKASGARLLLDIHYSDTWADPAHQTIPAAWAGLPFDSLEQRVETYTADAVAQLKHAGALPDIVQIGNEIDAGSACGRSVAWVDRTTLRHNGVNSRGS